MNQAQKVNDLKKIIAPKSLTTLNSTGSQHFLPQVVLVVTNRTIPLGDSLVLTHQNLLGNLVEQTVYNVSITGK